MEVSSMKAHKSFLLTALLSAGLVVPAGNIFAIKDQDPFSGQSFGDQSFEDQKEAVDQPTPVIKTSIEISGKTPVAPSEPATKQPNSVPGTLGNAKPDLSTEGQKTTVPQEPTKGNITTNQEQI